MKTIIRTPLLLLLAALTLMVLAPAFAAGTPQPVTITMYAFGNHLPSGVPSKPGPDGNTHDMLVPSDMVVQPGQQVTVKITNYDDEANGWDMAKSFDGQDQDGFMAGYIIVN